VPCDPDNYRAITIDFPPAYTPVSTNRWVTGATWQRSHDVYKMTSLFDINYPLRSLLMNRWISAVLNRSHQQTVDLIQTRDARGKDWAAAEHTDTIYWDRDLDTTALVDRSTDVHTAATQAAPVATG